MKKYYLLIFILSIIGTQSTKAQLESSKYCAYAYYKNKEYKNAIQLINDSVKNKDFGTYSILANCYLEQQDYKNALTNYLKADELEQNKLNDKIALCYAHLADKENTSTYLNKSLEDTGRPLLSELPIACIQIGIDASSLYDKASGQLNEAKISIDNKDFDQAIQILDSPEKGINKSLYYYYRALSFFNNGSIKQAATELKQAIKQNANIKKEKLFKDLCFASDDSADYYNYIICQTSDVDLDLQLEKINAYFALKKPESAQEAINQIEAVCIKFEGYSRQLINIYKKNGDYLNAFKTINSLISVNKADFKLLNERGQLFLDAKMYKEAKHDFSMSLDLCPNQADAYYQRGTARQALGEQSGAESDWKNAKNLGYFK